MLFLKFNEFFQDNDYKDGNAYQYDCSKLGATTFLICFVGWGVVDM